MLKNPLTSRSRTAGAAVAGAVGGGGGGEGRGGPPETPVMAVMEVRLRLVCFSRGGKTEASKLHDAYYLGCVVYFVSSCVFSFLVGGSFALCARALEKEGTIRNGPPGTALSRPGMVEVRVFCVYFCGCDHAISRASFHFRNCGWQRLTLRPLLLTCFIFFFFLSDIHHW